MIRVRKPAQAPAVLRTRGVRASHRLIAEYTGDPASYDTGAKTFAFNASLYGHESVRTTLIQAQHAKCAFCESKFAHISYGDVEHLRPKGGCRQAEGQPFLQPGYYWLAYDWTNLFLSCALCNQRFKKNLFPLKRPALRARNHMGDVASEEPLLIDPAVDEPEALIGFREEVPYAINGNERAESTIDVLGLRRTELAEQRWKILEKVKALRIIAGTDSPRAPWAREVLHRMQQDTEEYASMVRAFMRPAARSARRASGKSAATSKRSGTRGRRTGTNARSRGRSRSKR